MNASDTLALLNDKLKHHGLSELGWQGKLDHARRRFGVCRPSDKIITISRHLAELNSDEEVLDTILHEIAHALAFEQYQVNCGHDHRWKALCLQIGAKPVRCYSSQTVRQPSPRWLLCHIQTGEVFHQYFRRPTTDLKKLYIKGRKQETLGQLEIRPANNRFR